MSQSAARTQETGSSHWYTQDGKPMHTVRGAKGQERATTLSDARKLALLPSVTQVLREIAAPGLESWKREQACLAVLTAPRRDGEELDAFVHRILTEEKEHEQEARKAADLGTQIHDAITTCLWQGVNPSAEMRLYYDPVCTWLKARIDTVISTETILVGEGYAGRCDIIAHGIGKKWIIDLKTTKKLPERQGWHEHHEQLAAYAEAYALQEKISSRATTIRVANIYISTTEPGKIFACEWPDWIQALDRFRAALTIWCGRRDYWPVVDQESVDAQLDRKGL